jgi:hypothetical protein
VTDAAIVGVPQVLAMCVVEGGTTVINVAGPVPKLLNGLVVSVPPEFVSPSALFHSVVTVITDGDAFEFTLNDTLI